MDMIVHQAGLAVFAAMWLFVGMSIWRAARGDRPAFGGLRHKVSHSLGHG